MEALSKNKIKWIRSLRLKKNRDVENLFIVEGEKMVLELVNTSPDIIRLICSTTDVDFNLESYKIDSRVMSELSSFNTPNKHLAVVRKPEFDSIKEDLIVVLDGIQDPGNLGTIIRTCDWFGVDQIICSNDTVDIYNPKVIQASMGSIFRIPTKYTDLNEFLENTSHVIFGASLDGSSMYDEQFDEKSVIVIGNEGNGISPSVQKLIDKSILIPGNGQTESLNASIATGIMLAEFRRQISY